MAYVLLIFILNFKIKLFFFSYFFYIWLRWIRNKGIELKMFLISCWIITSRLHNFINENNTKTFNCSSLIFNCSKLLPSASNICVLLLPTAQKKVIFKSNTCLIFLFLIDFVIRSLLNDSSREFFYYVDGKQVIFFQESIFFL